MRLFTLYASRSQRQQLSVIVQSKRYYASKIDIPFAQPPFPVVESCPSPTCQCRETPPGLDIDREANLNGSMGTYAEQVLISTGRSDWKSRIEEDDDAALLRRLKGFLGRGGKYSDPYHNVLLTHSSIPTTRSKLPARAISQSDTVTMPAGKDARIAPMTGAGPTGSAFLVPSFKYVPSIPEDSNSVDAFIRAFVLPSRLHQMHDPLTREQKNTLLRQAERQRQFLDVRDIDEILILICGHGGRDDRCGRLGPILQDEFEEKLQRQNIPVLKGSPAAEAVAGNSAVEGYSPTARVAMISHIGGHKFAGNVIIYIPPAFSTNPLAGKGIWYGRVGPENVEGIVAKTVLGGKVIRDMFRGGIDRSGEILRL